MSGPLSGVRVLELAGVGAAPFAAMLLADSGADVLQIERPPREPQREQHPNIVEQGRRGNAINRGRRSVAIDLKDTAGTDLVLDLIASADVLIEGFRPGVAERLGVGPEECLRRNERLVYGRITGWGREGPLASFGGHDINFLALSGTLSTMGIEGSPPPIPLNVIADFGGGGLPLAFGIMCALFEVARSGQGQVVDIAMVNGAASLATYIHSMRSAGTWIDERQSNILDGGAPFYSVYETADHNYVAVGAIEPQFYAKLVEGLGLSLADLPSQLDRSTWPGLRAMFGDLFRGRTQLQWIEIFAARDACVSPVLSMREAPDHPQLRAQSTFVTINDVIQPATIPRYSQTPTSLPTSPTTVGVGGRDAMISWGVETAKLERLIARKVVSVEDEIAPS